MSADDETKNFKVYYHRDHVYLADRDNSGNDYVITESLVREFQSIIDRWKESNVYYVATFEQDHRS